MSKPLDIASLAPLAFGPNPAAAGMEEAILDGAGVEQRDPCSRVPAAVAS